MSTSCMHISLTNLKYESRLKKTVATLMAAHMFKAIYVIGLWDETCAELPSYNHIKYVYIKLFTRSFPKNSFFQCVKYFELIARLVLFMPTKNISIVSVHSLSLLPLGFLLKLIFKSSLIYDAHELETEKNKLHGFRKLASKLLEKSLIRFVNAMFVVSDPIARWYQYAYPNINPVVVYNSPRKPPILKSNLLREAFDIPCSTRILLYQGLLTSGRGIETLLNFSDHSELDFVIVFMGYGPLCESIKQFSSKCSKILFHPAVDPSVLLSYTQSADYGICLIEDTCLSYRLCMPNKLLEYSASGLPTLVSDLSELVSFVSINKCGVVADMSTHHSLDCSIQALFSLDYSEASALATKAASPYLWENQEPKILAVYQSLIDSGNL